MASLDPSWYHLSLLAVFVFIILCPPLRQRRNPKANLISSAWKKTLPDEEFSIDSILKPTLPQSWWTDEKQYQRERRAIFSTQWLMVAHTTRFSKPGDYRTFEIAGFSILLILGKDLQVRAFHNVCRHRAYAVTKKECGSSIVLGCKYHGWSYDTKGNLIKAPEFDKIPGFDKTANGLWEVKSVTQDGVVFVNFDTDDISVAIPSLHLKHMKKMSFVKDWKVFGSFNWKLLAELAESPSDMWQTGWKAFLPNFSAPRGTFMIAPNTISQRIDSSTTLIMRFLPDSASSTTVECYVYTKYKPENITEDLIQSIQTKVQSEVESLEMQQRRIQRGNMPTFSHATEHFEKLLAKHRKAEKEAGHEINPAAQQQSRSSARTEDDDFCRKLENTPLVCKANADGLLDW